MNDDMSSAVASHHELGKRFRRSSRTAVGMAKHFRGNDSTLSVVRHLRTCDINLANPAISVSIRVRPAILRQNLDWCLFFWRGQLTPQQASITSFALGGVNGRSWEYSRWLATHRCLSVRGDNSVAERGLSRGRSPIRFCLGF
jgi:hypothetical protein